MLEDSQAKTWHKTDTDTDIPSPTPPAGTAKQTASEAPDAFAAIAETYPGTIGAKGRKAEREARDLVETITENPVQLARLRIRRPTLPASRQRRPRATTAGPRLATWLRDQWETWAPEPITPTRQHKHTWNCEHVRQLMDPHEDEYDHSGSLREGNPSKWYLACQACADELNQETSKEKQ